MPTLTPTETTSLLVEAGSGGAACRVASRGGAFRAVLQELRGSTARVALVPDRALLLSGDDVRVDVRVGPGVRLHLLETSGTVAYDMRGGAARWDLSVVVEDGGSLVHETLPFVSSAGSDVRRTTRVDLAADASAILRETLVLGRHGEAAGRLLSSTRVRRAGREVLTEDLDGRDLAPYRIQDALLDLTPGASEAARGCCPDGVTRLVSESGAVVWRVLADQAHVAAAGIDRVWADVVARVPGSCA